MKETMLWSVHNMGNVLLRNMIYKSRIKKQAQANDVQTGSWSK